MHKTITRRAALQGGAATALVAGAVVATVATHPETRIGRLHREWLAAKAEATRWEEAEAEIYRRHPDLADGFPGVPLFKGGRNVHFEAEIERAFEPYLRMWGDRPEERAKIEARREHWRKRLQDARTNYDARVEAAGLHRTGEAWEAASDLACRLEREIRAAHAETLGDVEIQLAMLGNLLDDTLEEFETEPGEAVAAIAANFRRLASHGRAA